MLTKRIVLILALAITGCSRGVIIEDVPARREGAIPLPNQGKVDNGLRVVLAARFSGEGDERGTFRLDYEVNFVNESSTPLLLNFSIPVYRGLFSCPLPDQAIDRYAFASRRLYPRPEDWPESVRVDPGESRVIRAWLWYQTQHVPLGEIRDGRLVDRESLLRDAAPLTVSFRYQVAPYHLTLDGPRRDDHPEISLWMGQVT